MAYIPKSYNSQKMVAALQQVLTGEIYIPDSIQNQLARLPKKDHAKKRVENINLSKKQLQILTLIAKGLSNQQIATLLNRSEHTVKSHVSALFQILGANNRTECVKLAKQQLLIDEQ